MKKLLPLAIAFLLAGCSLNATVSDQAAPPPPLPDSVVYPAGFDGESTMQACRMNARDECFTVGVVSNGEKIERMRNASGGWTMAVESECRDGRCYVKDEDGVEWKLEP